MQIRPETLSDFAKSSSGETTPRSVGVHDIVAFGCLTGDYNRIHFDDHFSAGLPRGSRIAHGLLSASLALGSLSQEAPRVVGRRNPAAHLAALEVNYRRPVFPGDTLRTRWRAEPAAATLRTGYEIVNQQDEAVGDGYLCLALPADHGAVVEPPAAPAAWPAASFDPEPGRVYHLEDFQPGSHAGETEGHTLTEGEVAAFGGLTGDNGGLYCDEPFARSGAFGRRIVQPMLAFDVGFALWLKDWCRMGTPDSSMAGHLCDRWRFHGPFYPGDTLSCRYQTLAARASRSRPGMGLLTCGLQMLDQHGTVKLSAEVVMMYPART
jgi:acyl dehydratase